MATDVTPTVESSTTNVLESLTEKQMDHWRATGELPEKAAEAPPKSESAPAASTPAATTETPETPAKAAETPGESVPPKTESVKPTKDAEARIKQLLAKNKELEAKLEAKQQETASSVPAKKTDAPAKPSRNDLNEDGSPKFANDDEYQEARDQWVRDDAVRETRLQMQKDVEAARLAERQKLITDKWLNAMELGRTKHADFDTVVKMDDKGLIQHDEIKGIKASGVLNAWLVNSPCPEELLYHFGKTAGEVAKIEAMNPFAASRYLTKLEEKFTSGSSTPAAATPVNKGKETPRVPAPATNVSGKSVAPGDAVEAALEANDPAAYFKAMNERDLAKRK